MSDTTTCHLEDIAPIHAPFVQRYAADRLIADTTASIPHPYPDGAAQRFVAQVQVDRVERKAFVYAVCAQQEFVGVASLFRFDWSQRTAEVGYWIGVPFWGCGYATAAVAQLLATAEDLGLRTVTGQCLVRNPASRCVMEKNGFVMTHASIVHKQHGSERVYVLARVISDAVSERF